MTVQLTASTAGDVLTITLEGEINSITSARLQSQLLPYVSEGAKLLIDLTEVSYISSAGLRTLLIVHRQAQQRDAAITLVGLSDEVRFVMSATGFLDFFTIGADPVAERNRAGR
ncbi:STAS domain-containing protein [Streptacidiphilus fuscans]|uniref:Anti-sigma factor antagonist n=1 Tax=Streptacidiphilus fuscans TaxID=2789292 RepID=A0A931B792_9ACTN|nr:STAS domain-containing protein [Streptacidiphilus fuscans]MBF9070762.1 STAS domain-containing protein [Streptacidiphilus fuscans]